MCSPLSRNMGRSGSAFTAESLSLHGGWPLTILSTGHRTTPHRLLWQNQLPPIFLLTENKWLLIECPQRELCHKNVTEPKQLPSCHSACSAFPRKSDFPKKSTASAHAPSDNHCRLLKARNQSKAQYIPGPFCRGHRDLGMF